MLIIAVLFITLVNRKQLTFLQKFFSKRKNIVLNFQSFQDNFFSLFLFSIYKMVDSMDIYKPLNINIGTVMKNREC